MVLPVFSFCGGEWHEQKNGLCRRARGLRGFRVFAVRRPGFACRGTDGDNAVLMSAYGILSLLAFLLSAYYLKKANGKGVLYCGAALTLFSVLGMMSVGLVLLPGSLLIFIPSAIHRLEHRE